MDDLTKALIAAGEELAHEHAWSFGGDIGCPPLANNPFVTVVRKHIEPMVYPDGWRRVRIATLKAELALLESTHNVGVQPLP